MQQLSVCINPTCPCPTRRFSPALHPQNCATYLFNPSTNGYSSTFRATILTQLAAFTGRFESLMARLPIEETAVVFKSIETICQLSLPQEDRSTMISNISGLRKAAYQTFNHQYIVNFLEAIKEVLQQLQSNQMFLDLAQGGEEIIQSSQYQLDVQGGSHPQRLLTNSPAIPSNTISVSSLVYSIQDQKDMGKSQQMVSQNFTNKSIFDDAIPEKSFQNFYPTNYECQKVPNEAINNYLVHLAQLKTSQTNHHGFVNLEGCNYQGWTNSLQSSQMVVEDVNEQKQDNLIMFQCGEIKKLSECGIDQIYDYSTEVLSNRLNELSSLWKRPPLRYIERDNSYAVQCWICAKLFLGEGRSITIKKRESKYRLLQHLQQQHDSQVRLKFNQLKKINTVRELKINEIIGVVKSRSEKKVLLVDRQNCPSYVVTDSSILALDVLSRRNTNLAKQDYLVAESQAKDASDIALTVLAFHICRTLPNKDVYLLTHDHFSKAIRDVFPSLQCKITIMKV